MGCNLGIGANDSVFLSSGQTRDGRATNLGISGNGVPRHARAPQRPSRKTGCYIWTQTRHAQGRCLPPILKITILTSFLACFQLESKYESTQDVRTQLRFLEDLDRMERRRHDEQERELLLRAAKSRSKTEDPEQAKLKAKAKEVCLKSTFPFYRYWSRLSCVS